MSAHRFLKIRQQSRTPRSLTNGFSLLELIVVVSIMMIVAGYSVVNLLPAIRNNRMENALQLTLTQARRARQLAIDERRVHILTFVLPRSVQIQRIELDGALTPVSLVPLPEDIGFQAEVGIPTGPAATPDGFGTGAAAVDFNGGNDIFFQTDGSAQDALGSVVNGVVYIARSDEPATSRAVSLFGATGRIKSWKLAQEAGGSYGWQ